MPDPTLAYLIICDRVRRICGRIERSTPKKIWVPYPICAHLQYLWNTNIAHEFGKLLGKWLAGYRVLKVHGKPGNRYYDRSNKIALNFLRRKRLVVYDPERDVVMLDEENVLKLLEDHFDPKEDIR